MKTAARPLSIALILVAVLASLRRRLQSSGGGSGGGGPLTEKRAGEIAKQYVLDVFGILTGDVDAASADRQLRAGVPRRRQGV